MQLAFIIDTHTSECVVVTLDKLEFALEKELFHYVFPVILTDNSHEFTDIAGIERSTFDGKPRCKLFFCEPNRSEEKAECETNHKLIRNIIPKGASLEPFIQADISLMMDHINSYKRKSLLGKCPYDVASSMLPEDFFVLLGLCCILPEKVNLTPKLLYKGKHKND